MAVTDAWKQFVPQIALWIVIWALAVAGTATPYTKATSGSTKVTHGVFQDCTSDSYVYCETASAAGLSCQEHRSVYELCRTFMIISCLGGAFLIIFMIVVPCTAGSYESKDIAELASYFRYPRIGLMISLTLAGILSLLLFLKSFCGNDSYATQPDYSLDASPVLLLVAAFFVLGSCFVPDPFTPFEEDAAQQRLNAPPPTAQQLKEQEEEERKQRIDPSSSLWVQILFLITMWALTVAGNATSFSDFYKDNGYGGEVVEHSVWRTCEIDVEYGFSDCDPVDPDLLQCQVLTSLYHLVRTTMITPALFGGILIILLLVIVACHDDASRMATTTALVFAPIFRGARIGFLLCQLLSSIFNFLFHFISFCGDTAPADQSQFTMGVAPVLFLVALLVVTVSYCTTDPFDVLEKRLEDEKRQTQPDAEREEAAPPVPFHATTVAVGPAYPQQWEQNAYPSAAVPVTGPPAAFGSTFPASDAPSGAPPLYSTTQNIFTQPSHQVAPDPNFAPSAPPPPGFIS